MGCFSLFIDIPAAMSCQRWHVRWRGIYGCAICFRPFLLTGKDQRVKADIKGLPHLATAPPPCRPGPRAQPCQSLAFPHTVSVVFTFVLNDTFTPKPSWRTRIRHLLRLQRTKPSSSLRVIARRDDEAIQMNRNPNHYRSRPRHPW